MNLLRTNCLSSITEKQLVNKVFNSCVEFKWELYIVPYVSFACRAPPRSSFTFYVDYMDEVPGSFDL